MDIRVIPKPVEWAPAASSFVLTAETAVQGPEAFVTNIRRYFSTATGFPFPAASSRTNVLQGRIEPERFDRPGAYELVITPESVHAIAGDEAGLFYAVQTLRQLAPPEIFRSAAVYGVPWEIPCGRILDYPRFAWRGVMLDCSRHFFDVAYIKRFLDLLALHKFNVFHWHLIDDQGWRPEIRKYPRLIEIGAWRAQTVLGHSSHTPRCYDGKPHGGFYTQAQMREVVAYAAERHITVIPEIELPGHATAAIAAYPELGNTVEPLTVSTTWGVHSHILNAEESTIRFFQDVLDEIVEIFPSPIIHIGGDEVCMDEWKASPRVQARLRELGLGSERALQGYLLRRIGDHLSAHGRRLLGWDEVLEHDPGTEAVVMTWRASEHGVQAANRGHDVIMCPKDYTYLDYYQAVDQLRSEPLTIHGFVPLEKAYAFEPIPQELAAEGAGRVLGGQAQLWTEYIPDPERLHYMMYPRALAIAEALWTQSSRRDYADFRRRAPHHMRILQRLGVHGRPMD